MCKHCEWCELVQNKCMLLNEKCYEHGELVHEDCELFCLGEWVAEGEEEDGE